MLFRRIEARIEVIAPPVFAAEKEYGGDYSLKSVFKIELWSVYGTFVYFGHNKPSAWPFGIVSTVNWDSWEVK